MPFKKNNKKKNGTDYNHEKGKLIIRGLIIPHGWDEDGNITTIVVSTFDEKIYHIVKNRKGNELIKLVRKEVEIEGSLGIENGLQKIKVDRYVI